MGKRLYRSEKEKIVAGVCGGLAEYFNIDPALVRIIFVLTVLGEGVGLLLYVILWIILPTYSSLDKDSDTVIEENKKDIKEKVVMATKEIKKEVKSDTGKKEK